MRFVFTLFLYLPRIKFRFIISLDYPPIILSVAICLFRLFIIWLLFPDFEMYIGVISRPECN